MLIQKMGAAQSAYDDEYQEDENYEEDNEEMPVNVEFVINCHLQISPALMERMSDYIDNQIREKQGVQEEEENEEEEENNEDENEEEEEEHQETENRNEPSMIDIMYIIIVTIFTIQIKF